ncbi:MAG: chemotaxis protein CheB [Selenomonas sp.]|nr:chemotaxis protein CheB [Selenomonas sp.]
MAPFYEALLSTLLVLQAQYDQQSTSHAKNIGGGAVVTREIWHAGHKASPEKTIAPEPAEKIETLYKPTHSHINLIAIGASTGGTDAISAILQKLHPPLPGIVIVQHIPPMFSKLFADRLDHECSLTIKEAASGDVIMPNHVYIAPGGKHMTVQAMGCQYMLECKPGPPVHSVCPSVDVLFDSVADVAGDQAVGVILTGMGRDGADGLLHMRQKGSPTIGQDAASCTVYGMPKAAYECGAVQRQLPLINIPSEIIKLTK